MKSSYWFICAIFAFMGCSDSTIELHRLPPLDFHNGDIAFRRGEGLESQFIRIADTKKGIYTHVGILKKEKNRWMVIHAVPGETEQADSPDVVKMEPIESFYASNRSSSGCIMRSPCTDSQTKAVANAAKKKYLDHVRFDNDYDLEDTTELYCTEMVELLYRHIGYNLSQGRRHQSSGIGFQGSYIFPSDILMNNELKEIYHY